MNKTMKTITRWSVIVAAIAAAELYFGVDDTGARVALVLLIWAALSIPFGLALGAFIDRVAAEYGDDE